MTWISVEDRLPEDDQNILVLGSLVVTIPIEKVYLDFNPQVYSALFCNGYFLRLGIPFDYYVDLENVTHWMPLPEPPSNHKKHLKKHCAMCDNLSSPYLCMFEDRHGNKVCRACYYRHYHGTTHEHEWNLINHEFLGMHGTKKIYSCYDCGESKEEYEYKE